MGVDGLECVDFGWVLMSGWVSIDGDLVFVDMTVPWWVV